MSALLLVLALPVCAQAPLWSARLDPRIELLSTVQMLAEGYDVEAMPPGAAAYALALSSGVRSQRRHPAVRAFREIAAKAGVEHAARALLYYGPPPELRQDSPLMYSELDQLGGARRWNAFIEALRDFARRGDFSELYRRSENLRAPLLAFGTRELASETAPERFAEYARRPPPRRMLFYLAPLLRTERPVVSVRVNRRAGRLEQVRPWLDRLGFGFTSFGNSAGHDLLHEIIPDLDAATWADLRAYPLSRACGFAQDHWSDCLEEQLVYAITLRVERLGGRGGGSARELEARGFDRLEELVAALKDREQDGRLARPIAEVLPALARVAVAGREPLAASAGAEFWLQAAENEAARRRPERAKALLTQFERREPSAELTRRAAPLRERLKTMRRPEDL